MSSGSSETTTTTGGSSATEDPTSTKGGQTSVETTPSGQESSSAESSSSSGDSSSGDSNNGKSSGESDTAAIAAGVVVGVVGFCALLGAGFFLWRFKKRRAQPNYLNTGPTEHYNKPMSASSNSRFDGDFMAQRRQSNGSIDDDQDFSRRILQVISVLLE
jgi:cell wall integrity and stress response component